jgi:hypothetical protein
MDKARTGRPWRSWTAIAFVLLTLALIQACDSGKHTGPSTNSSVQLRLKQASGAELPAGCTGTYSVSGPDVNIQNAALPANGQISFQGQIGQTYTISVSVTCGQALRVKLAPGGPQTGSITLRLGAGNNEATIVLAFTQVSSVTCSPNPVDPGKDSICTCNFQSASVPTISWSGANPKADPRQATFNSTVPGGHDVSCSVNGIGIGTTTVNVNNPSAPTPSPPPAPPPPPPPPPPPSLPNGFVQVVNTSCCTLYAKVFVQPADTQVGGELAVTQTSPGSLPVPPGNYIVRIACSSGGTLFAPQGPLAVISGNTTVFSYSGSSTCG